MPGADPVAVIGMGATGTLLARALASAGRPIPACGRTPLAAITVRGLCHHLVDRGERGADPGWVPCRNHCGVLAGDDAADGL